MARQPGGRTQVAFAFESFCGTPPASGYRRMPFATTTLGSEQGLLSPELLGYGRDPQAPIRDAVNVNGDVVIPMDAENLGFWLKAIFGQPVTIGTTPRTHTFQSGGFSLRAGDRDGRTGPMAVFPCATAISLPILNQMDQYSATRFDTTFAALSDATRRGVLEHLGHTDASITELADKFRMSLTGMKKHVGVLEQVGLVTTAKVGRVRTCRLGARGLEDAAAWIESYRQIWAARFDQLDSIVEELTQQEKLDGQKTRE